MNSLPNFFATSHTRMQRGAQEFADLLRSDGLLEHVARIEGVVPSCPDWRAAKAIRNGLGTAARSYSRCDLIFSGGDANAASLRLAAFDKSGQLLRRTGDGRRLGLDTLP